MDNVYISDEAVKQVQEFHLPLYSEIPDIGLFLEQTTKFVSEYLGPVKCFSITGSMISNYVKKKLINNPVKKQYYREQIADIIFIGIVKSVLSLEEAQKLLQLQRENYEPKEAYEYFCKELENVLLYVFGLHSELAGFDENAPKAKELLRKVITAVAYKVYLGEAFECLEDSTQEE